MIKTYKSGMVFSTTVRMKSGANKFVSFVPYSFGGSIYTTTNADIQYALEHDSSFNKYFSLVSTKEDTPKEDTAEEQPTLKEVEVNDVEDAKQYLVDNFNASRRGMRSTASIKAIAEKNGIVFVGI